MQHPKPDAVNMINHVCLFVCFPVKKMKWMPTFVQSSKCINFITTSSIHQESMRRSITKLTTAGASTVTATFTVGLSDHSVTSPNLTKAKKRSRLHQN